MSNHSRAKKVASQLRYKKTAFQVFGQGSFVPDMISVASFVILQILALSATTAEVPRSSLDSFGQWASCSSSVGMCIDASQHSCSGPMVTGQCPGGSNILCCRAPYGISYSSCVNSYDGLCKHEGDCAGTPISGLCPGPSEIRCCPPSPLPNSPLPSSPVPNFPVPSSPVPSSPVPNSPLPNPATTITVDDVPVAPGIYLQQNEPAITQFRSGRSSIRPVIVVHTAETGGTGGRSDTRAERTANFIRTRTTYGSYHLIGDTDSIMQLVSFNDVAFHDGTGSNRWSIGISLAMKAADWPFLFSGERTKLVHVAAQMAAMAADWFSSQGVGKPDAVVLSREQSEASNASGFISHGARDPSRRSDPGADFPWEDFLAAYNSRIS